MIVSISVVLLALDGQAWSVLEGEDGTFSGGFLTKMNRESLKADVEQWRQGG